MLLRIPIAGSFLIAPSAAWARDLAGLSGPQVLAGSTFENLGRVQNLSLWLAPSGPCNAVAIGNQVWSTLANPFATRLIQLRA